MSETFVPVAVGTSTILVAIRNGDESAFSEQPVGALEAKLQDAFDGVSNAAKLAIERLQNVPWSSASVEFALEFGMESGKLTAILGTARSKATTTIRLEFSRPQEAQTD